MAASFIDALQPGRFDGLKCFPPGLRHDGGYLSAIWSFLTFRFELIGRPKCDYAETKVKKWEPLEKDQVNASVGVCHPGTAASDR